MAGLGRIMTEEEAYQLVSRLEALLPQLHRRGMKKKGWTAAGGGVVKETCDYIRRLRREVEELSRRLSELLEALDPSSAEADVIRSLLS